MQSKKRQNDLVSFKGKPFNITVIQVYAPTTNAKEAESWTVLWRPTRPSRTNNNKNVPLFEGDWNAKLGSQEISGVTDEFGLEIQNEAGQRLTEFCQENTLAIANTLCQQHKRQLYDVDITRWSIPEQIDYFFCSWKWRSSIQSAKTRPGADCGSDHELLIEWVAISFSRRSSPPRDQTWVFCIVGGFFTDWAIKEAPLLKNSGLNWIK